MFRHIGIVVSDLEKMLFFYKNLLGLEIISDEIESGFFLNKIIGGEEVSARIIKLGKNKQTIIELLNFNQTKKSSNKKLTETGLTHFALTIKNLDNLFLNLIENNIEVISTPQISVNQNFKVCFCLDYENNFVELVEIL